MQSFVADLLRYHDALVEPIEPEGLEVLAPVPVQRALNVAELSRLGFGSTLPAAAQRVGIEGDWLERFDRLLGPDGRWTRRVLVMSAKPPGDPERVLSHELVLDNATFRLLGVTPAWTRYLVMDFRATAVSDDKRDFMLRLGLNLATGALPDAMLPAIESVTDSPSFDEGEAGDGGNTVTALPDDISLPPIWDRARLLDLATRAVQPRLDTALSPFIKSLRRRLNRDQDRLHQYHNDLYREATQRAIALPEQDPRRRREEQRAEAIGHEYRAKLEDLERQYAMRVSVEWVRTLELVMPVHRFAVQVRRRKSARTIDMDWNPLARRLEPPACEFTASGDRPRLVCDDALHLVVPAGLAPCASCGRAFCRVCHPELCPKCGSRDSAAPNLRVSMELLTLGNQ